MDDKFFIQELCSSVYTLNAPTIWEQRAQVEGLASLDRNPALENAAKQHASYQALVKDYPHLTTILDGHISRIVMDLHKVVRPELAFTLVENNSYQIVDPRQPDGGTMPSEPQPEPQPEPSRSLAPDEDGVLGCEKNWADMNQRERAAITVLGWSDSSWEAGDQGPMRQAWNSLTSEQLAAARLLGFDELDFKPDPPASTRSPVRRESRPTHNQQPAVSQRVSPGLRLSPTRESPPPRGQEPSVDWHNTPVLSGTEPVQSPPKSSPDPSVAGAGKHKRWEEMTTAEQKAVVKLGWTADSWNGGEQSLFSTSWEQLSPLRQQDAVFLGFDPLDFAPTGEQSLEDPIPEEEADGGAPVFRGFQVGDRLQVYSKSAGNWIGAEVDKVQDSGHVRVLYSRDGIGMRKTPHMRDLRVLVEVELDGPLGAEFVPVDGGQMLAVTKIESVGTADNLAGLREGMLLAEVGDQDVTNGDHEETMALLQEALSGPRPLRMVFVPPASPTGN